MDRFKLAEYNNPALGIVDGVLTSHCVVCGRYNGNECDTDWFTLIRRKYCPKCGKAVTQKLAAERQRIRRANIKRLRRESALKDDVIKALREQITLVREENAKLKNERNIRK
jgi:hypothetical protein